MEVVPLELFYIERNLWSMKLSHTTDDDVEDVLLLFTSCFLVSSIEQIDSEDEDV